jgi:hypothetical protein
VTSIWTLGCTADRQRPALTSASTTPAIDACAASANLVARSRSASEKKQNSTRPSVPGISMTCTYEQRRSSVFEFPNRRWLTLPACARFYRHQAAGRKLLLLCLCSCPGSPPGQPTITITIPLNALYNSLAWHVHFFDEEAVKNSLSATTAHRCTRTDDFFFIGEPPFLLFS